MKLLTNEPLAKFTSLKVGGPAAQLIITEDTDDLLDIIKEQRRQGPLTVLGYGTNCLVSDKGIPGTTILNMGGSYKKLSPTTFRVESGMNWDDFVQVTIENKLWGLEFSSGIPGGVGAAIVGDIAAYGHKVADTLLEATLLHPDGSIEIWKNEDFEFSYRTSALQNPAYKNLVILDAVFELSDSPTSELEYHSALKVAEQMGVKPDTLENRRKIIMETRRRAGSLLKVHGEGHWTAGSFFKNPMVTEEQAQEIIKHEETNLTIEQIRRQNTLHTGDKTRVAAAHVLLAAGFHRGQTWGQVRLHPDHILKVENIGDASAQEIHDVVQHIVATVKQTLGIALEPEVKFIGDFD